MDQSEFRSSDGFLRIWQVIGDRRRGIPPLIPVCRSSWWQGIRDGRFPQPVKLGARTTVWRASDIAKLLEAGVGDSSQSHQVDTIPPNRETKEV